MSECTKCNLFCAECEYVSYDINVTDPPSKSPTRYGKPIEPERVEGEDYIPTAEEIS